MHKNEKLIEQVAADRMGRLYSLAKKSTMDNRKSTSLARRYIRMAKKMASHYNVKMPAEMKRGICRRCGSVMVPGVNCSVRISGKRLIYKCECGNDNRHALK